MINENIWLQKFQDVHLFIKIMLIDKFPCEKYQEGICKNNHSFCESVRVNFIFKMLSNVLILFKMCFYCKRAKLLLMFVCLPISFPRFVVSALKSLGQRPHSTAWPGIGFFQPPGVWRGQAIKYPRPSRVLGAAPVPEAPESGLECPWSLPCKSGILHHQGLSAGGWGPWQLVNLQWGLKAKSAIELFCYLDWGLAPLLICWRKWFRNPPWQALSLSRNHSDLTHLAIHSECLY